MYPVISQNRNETGDSFWDQFATIPGTIESHVPTFDKSLDSYFDQHFAAIIEEWELVPRTILRHLQIGLRALPMRSAVSMREKPQSKHGYSGWMT